MVRKDTIRQLSEHFRQHDIHNVVVLTDENVERLYPDYFTELSGNVRMDKITVPAGEDSKSIETAVRIWDYLADKQYDRSVFLLNFGGGMITDLGGFVAATYKRGIRFANFPTTLLAMIDASVGGKTGINLHYLKNGVGAFYFPEIQLPADVSLLDTLPETEMLSGFGELVKYALIGSKELFLALSQFETFPEIKQEHIDFCIDFKQNVVKTDPKDENIRHILNFGHTIGHAIESRSAETGSPVAHGVAVAQGLYYESLLSTRVGLLPQEEWQQIADFLPKHFPIPEITPDVLEKILPYMRNDKKNHDKSINFTLIDHIGHAIPDQRISELNQIAGVCDTPLQPLNNQ